MIPMDSTTSDAVAKMDQQLSVAIGQVMLDALNILSPWLGFALVIFLITIVIKRISGGGRGRRG